MDKNEVAAVLGQIGILLELKGENPFKTRAYLTAVRVLESLEGSLEELVAAKRLGELKGSGSGLGTRVKPRRRDFSRDSVIRFSNGSYGVSSVNWTWWHSIEIPWCSSR